MLTILRKIAEQETLSRAEAEQAMHLLLTGRSTAEEIAGLLLGLRARGESMEELTGFTHVMRSHAVAVELPDSEAVDIVGTGGDGLNTFNISTATAFVCAGAGAVVAKHGNRSASSRCGSAEVLEELGVRADLGKSGVEHCLNKAGIAFMYAPRFHPAMRHVMPIRKALGVRTCFNILGPLCNPAGVRRYVVGAFSLEIAEMMASILVTLGATHVVTLHADEGMDEASISGHTTLFLRTGNNPDIQRIRIEPSDVGLAAAPISTVIGGDARENARILLDVLGGAPGPQRDVVALNAGIALLAAGKADSIREGVLAALESIDGGHARRRLDALVDASHEAPTESPQSPDDRRGGDA